MFVLQIKYQSLLNIYSICKHFFFFDHKKYILRCEVNNRFLKVSEAPNLWYSLD